MNVLAFWPIIKWVLQALGLMGPEDKEAERKYRLALLEAQARKDEGLIKAFADFHSGQSQAMKLVQALLVAALYYDIFRGERLTITTAQDLFAAGIPGLLITSILLFPFYGPALVAGVSKAFDTMIDLTVRRTGSGEKTIVSRGLGTRVPGPEGPSGLSSEVHPHVLGIKDEPRPFTSDTGFRRETDPEVGSPEVR